MAYCLFYAFHLIGLFFILFCFENRDHRSVDIGPGDAVALAFITFVTVFNYMEIYKRRDVFERQLASILEKHIEIKNKL